MHNKKYLHGNKTDHGGIIRKNSRNELCAENKRLRSQIAEIKKLYTEMREQAIRDPLTGAYNRRHVESMLSLECIQERREINSISVIMLDLDNFKKINDTYGHAIGDMALRTVGETLKQMTRAGDVVCRYGGDEFIIFLHNAKLEIAHKRAEEWRQAVEKSPFTYQGMQVHMTVSVGVANYTEERNTLAMVIDAADEALYWAKSMGRNCVATADNIDQTFYSLPCDFLANRDFTNVKFGLCN